MTAAADANSVQQIWKRMQLLDAPNKHKHVQHWCETHSVSESEALRIWSKAISAEDAEDIWTYTSDWLDDNQST